MGHILWVILYDPIKSPTKNKDRDPKRKPYYFRFHVQIKILGIYTFLYQTN